jgi:hypothetical protein
VGYEPPVDAELNVGDVIRSCNGRIEALKTGDPVVLEVERQGVMQFVAFEME